MDEQNPQQEQGQGQPEQGLPADPPIETQPETPPPTEGQPIEEGTVVGDPEHVPPTPSVPFTDPVDPDTIITNNTLVDYPQPTPGAAGEHIIISTIDGMMTIHGIDDGSDEEINPEEESEGEDTTGENEGEAELEPQPEPQPTN
jgi:hypothetical protein